MAVFITKDIVAVSTFFLRLPRTDCYDWFKNRRSLIRKTSLQQIKRLLHTEDAMPDFIPKALRIFKRHYESAPSNCRS